MYRVVTLVREERGQMRGRLKKDFGPWHEHREQAEQWAHMLAGMGYATRVETLSKGALAHTTVGKDNF